MPQIPDVRAGCVCAIKRAQPKSRRSRYFSPPTTTTECGMSAARREAGENFSDGTSETQRNSRAGRSGGTSQAPGSTVRRAPQAVCVRTARTLWEPSFSHSFHNFHCFSITKTSRRAAKLHCALPAEACTPNIQTMGALRGLPQAI